MAEIKIKLQPFRVPNYVLIEGAAKPRQEGFTETPKYNLSELSEETLIELCEEFKANVLKKHRTNLKSE